MRLNSKARNEAILRLMRQGYKKEGIVLFVLSISFIYALASNLLTHCTPLPLPANVLDILASIDETIRNTCYGLIASTAFYLAIDFYKSAYKMVDIYNDMYPSLYNLWLKTYQLVYAMNGFKLDKSQNNDELQASIIMNFCKQEKEDLTNKMTRKISSDLFHLLYVQWDDALKDKEKFLETYGHILEREEHAKLNDKELNTTLERLKEYVPSDEQIAKAIRITISNYDIQRTIYLILKYKTDLASMVNKYSIFYYGDQRGIRKDAF